MLFKLLFILLIGFIGHGSIPPSTIAEENFVTPHEQKERSLRLSGDISLQGTYGASMRWGSGWLDLNKAIDFKTGDKLILKIGGTAKTILLRLLPQGQTPDEPFGIVNGPIEVPPNRILEINLKEQKEKIVQISVHGGPHPWHYSLGIANGPASLELIKLSRP